MNNFPQANSLSVSVRIYRALLVAYPKTFREHYETQMVQVFRDSIGEAYHHHGMPGLVDLWLHTFVDLFVTALMERFAERSQYMFSPRIIMWAGVASAFGGVMWLFRAQEGGEITLPLALLLTLAGLAALHLRQGKQASALGWAGFVLGLLGTGLLVLSSFFVPDTTPGMQFELGMSIMGIGYILIGLRTLQTKILHRSSAMLSFVIGVLQIGFGFCVWLMYYLTPDPWNPMTIPASAAMLLFFSIGILWIALGATLAINPGWETSNPPPASA
jgi:hypothetical protein